MELSRMMAPPSPLNETSAELVNLGGHRPAVDIYHAQFICYIGRRQFAGGTESRRRHENSDVQIGGPLGQLGMG
jgi:hypothetical protein